MTKDEAMQMALDVLQALNKDGWILADFENQVYAATDALRTALAQPDTQIGITYEEANPPEPYCQRCGKKLGTEVTDIHTCTPKEIQPVAWHEPEAYNNVTVHKKWAKENGWLPLYAAPLRKEWVGLTKEEVVNWNLPEGATVFEFVQFVEAKLKEKNG